MFSSLGILAVILSVLATAVWSATDVVKIIRVKRESSATAAPHYLSKCGHSENDTEEADEFPADLFTVEQLGHGAVVLHFIGLAYMFVALATVCDEFFVPALDIITAKFHLSEDVAGATFMAAGGSAPELFAALIGLFISHSNVGIGTIVGSASFNILFVIAMCTIFSSTALHITWWPLFRDVTFYMIDLGLVIYFFNDERIYWYEALILLLTYVCYVVFMKFNGQIETFVKTKLLPLCLCKRGRVASAIAVIPASAASGSRPTSATKGSQGLHNIMRIHGGSLLRQGIAHMMVQSLDPTHNLKHSLPSPAIHGDSKVSLSYLHIDRPLPQPGEVNHPNFTETEKEQNGFTGPTTNETANSQNGSNNQLRAVESEAQEITEDTEESKPLDLSMPPTWRKRIPYLLIMPIVFPLWLTIPDVRNPKWHKWYVVSFLVSILWLGIFSYLTIWWATTIGHTLCIPNEIMGLTILAAGTSIPDMLNSIIVARRGLGDMAISSQVGSNIFDITVGLNVPWLLWFMKEAIQGHSVQSISVESNGLACSVGLLFIMIFFLVSCIALFKWRITKVFGVILLVGYVFYCTIIILIEMGKVPCPLKS